MPERLFRTTLGSTDARGPGDALCLGIRLSDRRREHEEPVLALI